MSVVVPAVPRPASTAAVVSALLAVYLIWGSTYLGIRFGLEGFPPLLMAGLRFLAAGLAFYALLRWRGYAAPTRAQWKNLAVMGFLMMLMGNGLVCVAQQEVSSGLAAIAVASLPLWAGLFGWLKGRHPSRGEWLGLGVGFAGVLWLNAGSDLSASPRGAIALLAAPAAWAWGSIWSRDRDLPTAFMSTAGQMLTGGVLLVALGWTLGERIVEWPATRPLLAVGYLAVFGSIVAYSAYVWLLDHVRPALATSYAYVNPPVAVLLGALLAGERFGVHAIGAMAVILAGVAIVMLSRAKR
ncbi:drug/metabolite exporter YedA [Rehaibacterium terrae]|jgi:drug/metabolite transporter (DMT)-like permease|uniref:Drug/metabolite transporter (DMT)-like permease n=1 Tax=Rehaibacterium terrae TaxID=1341696 RepID=A0A7W7XYJ7_9GAMM|nr:drug/metabolite exporter YedA [Rehaibacterium terrae]MBB5014795.1 drug/metabolite transporter (DMT)-like permease [Rehaibacterium terrae]